VTPELLTYPLDAADIFVLNEAEGGAICGSAKDAGAGAIADELHRRFPHAEIVLTLGEDGSLYRSSKTSFALPAENVVAVDTTGAGDTFCGYFLAGTAKALPAEACIRRATRAAAIAVTRKGAATAIPISAEVPE
jgi:ribokinase